MQLHAIIVCIAQLRHSSKILYSQNARHLTLFSTLCVRLIFDPLGLTSASTSLGPSISVFAVCTPLQQLL